MNKECFPKFKIKLNQRKSLNPWITKCVKRSSKRKEKLYEQFLKKRTVFNEIAYKANKSLFEAIKRKSKKALLTKDIPIQTWRKEKMDCYEKIIGKAKHNKTQTFLGNLKLVTK